jgi:hypothetical protein
VARSGSSGRSARRDKSCLLGCRRGHRRRWLCRHSTLSRRYLHQRLHSRTPHRSCSQKRRRRPIRPLGSWYRYQLAARSQHFHYSPTVRSCVRGQFHRSNTLMEPPESSTKGAFCEACCGLPPRLQEISTGQRRLGGVVSCGGALIRSALETANRVILGPHALGSDWRPRALG